MNHFLMHVIFALYYKFMSSDIGLFLQQIINEQHPCTHLEVT